MAEFYCDFSCRTVGEGITRYQIPDSWYAEFDVYDDIYPTVMIQIAQIRKSASILGLKLRIVDNTDVEYAGCIVLPENKTIIFKVDTMNDLLEAMITE